MGGSKSGSDTTETKVRLPDVIEKAATENLAIANEVAGIGWTPYLGPTVAGFSPQQINAMQNTNRSAGAFGLANVDLGPVMSQDEILTALTGMMPPNTSMGGVTGYSGVPMFQAALDQMPEAQRRAIESFTMNPATGAPPVNPAVPVPQFQYQGENSWWNDPEQVAAYFQNRRPTEDPSFKPYWWELPGDPGPGGTGIRPELLGGASALTSTGQPVVTPTDPDEIARTQKSNWWER